LLQFFSQRLQTLLQDEQGIDYDLVKAVLNDEHPEAQERALTDILDLLKRAQFLQQIRQDGRLHTIYETVNRSTRLAAKGSLPRDCLSPQTVVQPQLFEKQSENEVYEALERLLPLTQAAQIDQDYEAWLEAMIQIIPSVSNFFDGPDSVLVMAESLPLRENRLNLLGLIRNHASLLADFGAIVKS
jgi:glycyl-tRNA synthetase beta chain